MGLPTGKEKLEMAVAPRSGNPGITRPGIGLEAVDSGEAVKVLVQVMKMADLRATRTAMATSRATTETLWPRV